MTKSDGVAGEHGLVGDVLGDHRLAEALRRDEHDVARAVEEVELRARPRRRRGRCVVGQAQSKSAMGLKRPRRLRRDAALEAAARAVLLLELDDVLEELRSDSSAAWSRARRGRRAGRRWRAGRGRASESRAQVIRRHRRSSLPSAGGRERVVGGERVRRDAEIADARIVGQHGVERRRRRRGRGALVEDVGDGARRRRRRARAPRRARRRARRRRSGRGAGARRVVWPPRWLAAQRERVEEARRRAGTRLRRRSRPRSSRRGAFSRRARRGARGSSMTWRAVVAARVARDLAWRRRGCGRRVSEATSVSGLRTSVCGIE